MRLKNIGKSLLLGGALALALSACKDDTTNNTSDSGMDAGRDAGQDAGRDAGQDAGPPPPPAHLRIAHLAWGTGVGNVHLCAYSPTGGDRILITSDALATGNFQGATMEAPLRPGSISKHFDVPTTVSAVLGGRVIEVYKQSEAGAVITGGFGSCSPVGGATILASATLGGSGAGAIQLSPGGYSTVAIVGSAGAETQTGGSPLACPNPAGPGNPTVACPGVSIVTLQDEHMTSTAATARVRIVNANPLVGAPAICQNLYMASAANIAAVGASTHPFIGLVAPTYEDVAPFAMTDGDGGPVLPRVLTIHPAGSGSTTATLCAATGAAAVGTIAPAQETINAFTIGASQGAGTLRLDVPANAVTTLFVVPATLMFGDAANSNADCIPGSSATCLPMKTGFNLASPGTACAPPTATCLSVNIPCTNTTTASSQCYTVPGIIPIADSTP